jgi:hypothetical protein
MEIKTSNFCSVRNIYFQGMLCQFSNIASYFFFLYFDDSISREEHKTIYIIGMALSKYMELISRVFLWMMLRGIMSYDL